jgi:hypothetical protein
MVMEGWRLHSLRCFRAASKAKFSGWCCWGGEYDVWLGKPGCFTVGRQSRSEPQGMEKGEQAPHQPWTAESINVLTIWLSAHTLLQHGLSDIHSETNGMHANVISHISYTTGTGWSDYCCANLLYAIGNNTVVLTSRLLFPDDNISQFALSLN